jgi:hypothetical protein
MELTALCARKMAASTSKRHGPLISTPEIEAIIRAHLNAPGWSNASLIACNTRSLSAFVDVARVVYGETDHAMRLADRWAG